MSSEEIYEMASYVEKASRVELLVRWVYGIAIGIIYYFWAIYVGIVEFLQFFHILIFGRRGSGLYRSTRRYLAAQLNAQAYLAYLTDQRPELMPDLLVFLKKALKEPPTSAEPAQPTVPPLTATKHCTSCGAEILINSRFCDRCGAAQT
jgi:hypothetical protein